MSKTKIGISIGDVNGIGPEVIIKALSNELLLKQCTPIIYGSSKSIGYHKNVVEESDFSFVSIQSVEKAVFNKVNVLNCVQEPVHISLGKVSKEAGQFAYIALDHAVQDLKAGRIHALVTAPINKQAMQLAEFPYVGHTEFLAEQLSSDQQVTMMMVADDLRIGLVTSHVPLGTVSSLITKELVLNKIKGLNHTLKQDFGFERPTIAVLGLNPHAGEESQIGDEENLHIRPAIIEAKKGGILASGPYPADGFFGSQSYRKFDCILAMYHDQGLIAFKTLSFGRGVNYTAGLSQIRTSPDHGTAFDIAGSNKADEGSMRQALYLAMDIYRNRQEFIHSSENRLVASDKEEEFETA